MKVVFCTPTRKRPHEAYVQAMEDSLPLIEAKGIDHAYVYRVGNPYISYVMADALHRDADSRGYFCLPR